MPTSDLLIKMHSMCLEASGRVGLRALAQAQMTIYYGGNAPLCLALEVLRGRSRQLSGPAGARLGLRELQEPSTSHHRPLSTPRTEGREPAPKGLTIMTPKHLFTPLPYKCDNFLRQDKKRT